MAKLPIPETMPCRPDELQLTKYLLPGLFGYSSAEEAAARLLCCVQTMAAEDDGEWTGVRISDMQAIIDAEEAEGWTGVRTLVQLHGAQAIMHGLGWLRDQALVKIEHADDTMVFPTAALVTAVQTMTWSPS